MSSDVIAPIIAGGFLLVNSLIALLAAKMSKKQNKMAKEQTILHVMINSRMTELLETSEKLSRLAGIIEGIEKQKQEAKDEKAQIRLENKEDKDSNK